MGLESATYVADLVATNPTGSDQKSQGDDHLRLLKTVLQAELPQSDGFASIVATANWTKGGSGYLLKPHRNLVIGYLTATNTGTASGVPLTLPVGFRPASQILITTSYFDASLATLFKHIQLTTAINTDGTLNILADYLGAAFTAANGDIFYICFAFKPA